MTSFLSRDICSRYACVIFGLDSRTVTHDPCFNGVAGEATATHYASFQYHWTQLTSTSLEFISTGWQLVCRWWLLAVTCVMRQPTMFGRSIYPAVSSTRDRLYHFGKKKEESPRGMIRLKIHITDHVCRASSIIRLEILPLIARHRNHGRLRLEPRNGKLRRATLHTPTYTHIHTYDYYRSKSVCSPHGCDPTLFRICIY